MKRYRCVIIMCMEDDVVSSRQRIVRAALALLSEGGREAVSTRAVSAAAGVQAPTIYRQFGDMQGLLDAVASQGFAAYLDTKTNRQQTDDPVEDLRQGWDLHVGFGVANPALYRLMYGGARPGAESPGTHQAAAILRGLVQRVAAAGRLRVAVEQAAQLIHAAGSGVTMSLIATPPAERDDTLSVLARETVLAAITTVAPTERPAAATDTAIVHAIALRASPTEALGALTPAERGLLDEWLDRIARTCG